MALVSVIIPTHNRRALLLRKLQALKGQGTDFEVVVVADGCTDGTVEALSAYPVPYPLKLLESEGRGAAYARNRGAEAAAGEILLFSDDDIIPSPGWMAAHRAAHRAGNIVAVGRLILPAHLRQGAAFHGPGAYWWNATGANTSLPRALFFSAGSYDESFSDYGGEDPDLGWRLHSLGARFSYRPDAAAEHWDEEYLTTFRTKAFAAGQAHVHVWRKYHNSRVSLALGVHPVVLAVKLAFLPRLERLLGPHGSYELAYARGAWKALWS